MSKKSNPTMIGAFVVGAIALLAVAAALFGGAELFAKRYHFVAYFEEQTKGLRVGSNVVLNGVRIGYVSDIALLVDQTEFETMTRVTLELLPDTLTAIENGRTVSGDMRDVIPHDNLLRQGGLRAQLEVESFITGQLLIRLVLRPETPIRLSGMESEHPEIPTIQSNIQEMLARLRQWVADFRDKVDIEALADGATDALTGFASVMNSPDLHESLAGINTLINDADTQELGTSMKSALDEVGAAASEAETLFATVDDDIAQIAADLRPALKRLDESLTTANEVLEGLRRQVSSDSEQIYQLQSTLREVEGAAAALREFFDYMERNPEALLRGKKE